MMKHGRFEVAGLVSLIGVGFALSLSGCGSNVNQSLVRDPVEYIKQSCEYSADEGKDYSTVRSSMPVVTGYFGKLYNKDWLLNVGHTSMRDTLTSIEKTDAKVYHSGIISQKSCKNFGFAATMPSDIAQEWQKNEGRGAEGEFVAGLYLIKGTRQRESLKTKAAIIVREDANRWTLVHEFMHHNFKTQAVLKGYDDDRVQEKRNILADQLNKIVNHVQMTNREKVKKATPLFLEFIAVADQLVIQYMFEEIAVEATLQDRYDSGDLTFVPAGSYGNATWYIAHSKEKVEAMYVSLDGLYKTLHDLAIFSGGVYKESFELDKHKELKEKRLAQLDEMLADREAKRYKAGSFAQMTIDGPEAVPTEGFAPCAEAIQIDREVSEFAKSIRKITD